MSLSNRPFEKYVPDRHDQNCVRIYDAIQDMTDEEAEAAMLECLEVIRMLAKINKTSET